jgi:inositol phosphorylceramide mannosyltransferase catalytic subunit
MESSITMVHSVWIGPNPAPRVWMDSVQNFSEKYKYTYILWDNQRVENFPMKNRKHFVAAQSWAGKADILRYEILEKYGGIYIDADTVIVQHAMLNLLLQTFNDDSAFGYEDDNGLIANGVIVAKKHSAFMQALIDAIPLRDHSEPAWRATGPLFVTDMYQRYKNTIDIRVYPSIWFYPRSWHGITTLDLHTTLQLPPESMMFQYGYSTNNLGPLIGLDGYAANMRTIWKSSLLWMVVMQVVLLVAAVSCITTR